MCLILVLGLVTAHAQSDNLLTNPGFEPPFEPVAGNPTSLVAQGWTAWSLESDQNMQPEYYPASDTTNGMATPRIHGGEDAQQYFTFFAAHIGGVYQQVAGVAAGDQLQFSVYAYVWSSSGDDANASDGSGELAVQVGIDPNGGTDPASDSIVWSSPLSFVDQFAQHTVAATAAADTVTVYVRSAVNRVAMNNVVYLDDAELIVTGSEQVATETVGESPIAEMTPIVEASPEVTEVMTEAVMPEVTAEVTEAATEAATVEVTEVVATEALPTEAPTEGSTNRSVPPTEVPPTEVPTEVPPTEVPTEVPPTVTPFPSPTLDTVSFPFMYPYMVERGDTVGQLATRFGTTIEAIIIANQLGPDARIFESQTLVIPVKSVPPPTLVPTNTSIPAVTLVPSETPIPPLPTEAPVIVQPVQPEATQQSAEQPIIVAPPQVTTYIVRYGDTLSSIAVRNHLTTRELANFNGIVNPNMVYVGQVLKIPPAGEMTAVPPTSAPPTPTTVPPTPVQAQQLYRVERGDNLYRISIRFNVPLARLIEVNGIADPTRIFVGQILIIPAS
ncbi:MAG: LysM peptidoglycan-binding domain-containing protein [Anaerolineae bacterium]